MSEGRAGARGVAERKSPASGRHCSPLPGTVLGTEQAHRNITGRTEEDTHCQSRAHVSRGEERGSCHRVCPRSVTGTYAGCGRQKEAAANKQTGLPSLSVEHFHKQLIPFSDDPHVKRVRLTEVKQAA